MKKKKKKENANDDACNFLFFFLPFITNFPPFQLQNRNQSPLPNPKIKEIKKIKITTESFTQPYTQRGNTSNERIMRETHLDKKKDDTNSPVKAKRSNCIYKVS